MADFILYLNSAPPGRHLWLLLRPAFMKLHPHIQSPIIIFNTSSIPITFPGQPQPFKGYRLAYENGHSLQISSYLAS